MMGTRKLVSEPFQVPRPVARYGRGLQRIRFRNRYLLISDLLLLPAAVYFSYVLRLEAFDLNALWGSCLQLMLVSVVTGTVVFYLVGLYSRYWQYASVDDLALLFVSVCAAAGWSSGLMLASHAVGVPGISRVPFSVPPIFLLLALAVVVTPRGLVRMLGGTGFNRVSTSSNGASSSDAKPTVIFGAGDAGVMTLRELHRNPRLGIHVVGFLDDDSSKHGLRIHGVPILGGRYTLPEVVASHGVRRAVIAMPTVAGRVVRELVELCNAHGVQPQILPGLYQLIGGSVRVDQLRDVGIEDLLRREPIQTDMDAVGHLLRGRRILITGAGGSIGSELCRQVVQFQPATLVLLGHGENSIFAIHRELSPEIEQIDRRLGSNASSGTTLIPVIADFRFRDRMEAIFREFRPEIVFHAGAHKHVPLMEANPGEAITNNVLGTRNVLLAAQATGVERFVFVSTDKAVNPTSVMGASKRVAELLVHQTAAATGQAYMVVRFGNVLGSRGSVVLTMKEQIAAGGPVTVTHPLMQRYFMTIPEAVQLILQAAVLGTGGDVFLFDMGDPVRIIDLAHDLIRLSGLEVGEDIDVQFVGARPGEKLFEELFLPSERYEQTAHDKIFTVASSSRERVHPDLDRLIDDLAVAAQSGDADTIRHLLQHVVPQYQPGSHGTVRASAPPGGDVRVSLRPSPPRDRPAVPLGERLAPADGA
jgi:FlaA1/EpsC-like NDP-sugar epimerase